MKSEVFLLTQPVCAVRLAGEKQTATVLETGASITVIRRQPSVAGLIDVECRGREYALFQQDLLSHAKQDLLAGVGA